MKSQYIWREITQNIKNMVESCGKSKTQIAAETGIHKSTLSQYLSGRSYPELATLKRLVKALECSYEDILGPI